MSVELTEVELAVEEPFGAPTTAHGEFARAWGRFRKHKLAVASLVFVCLLILAAIFAPWIAPYSYSAQDLFHRFAPAFTGGHLLGTDNLGRDVLSRMIYALRTALVIGFGAELIALLIAIVVGLLAGYRGGRLDTLLMAGTDIMYAFPAYLFAILMVVVLGRSVMSIIVAICVTSWVTQARLVRAQVMRIKNYDYIEAAQALGTGGFTIAVRYILPNAVGPMLVTTSFGIPAAIAAESGLALLGLGVEPPTPSWGSMISDGYTYVLSFPGLILYPLVLFGLTMLAFTWIGDGLRDAFDTREEGVA